MTPRSNEVVENLGSMTIELPALKLDRVAECCGRVPVNRWGCTGAIHLDHRLISDSTLAARVLFVDDLPELRRTMSRSLRALGHLVVEAEGARTALDAAQAQHFDVVLSDVMMPEVNGLELLRSLRERDPSLPVVLMSTLPTADIAHQAMASGAFAYLAKPVAPDLLRATIARALGARRTAS